MVAAVGVGGDERRSAALAGMYEKSIVGRQCAELGVILNAFPQCNERLGASLVVFFSFVSNTATCKLMALI